MPDAGGKRDQQGRRGDIGPQDAAPFDQRIRLEFDLLGEPAFHGLGRDFDALAGEIELPAVIGAAKAAIFIATEPE
jgi:hypothetical protein